MKRFFLTVTFALAALQAFAQGYWNQSTRIMPLRIPVGENPEFLDLNGDGRQDAVKSYIYGDITILWLDEDGNMKEGDIEGDTVNDCLLADRNKDGKYDLIIKWADQTGNGKADLNLIIEYPRDGIHNINYMYVFDDDGDGVFNYFDWNAMTLSCWEKNGISDFYTDYSGNSTFLKTHRKPDGMQDLRYQWENPFLFYDWDGDGLSEMAVRFCDGQLPDKEAEAEGFDLMQHQGWMHWFSMGIDMDNDNAAGNDFDFDMTLCYRGEKAIDYRNLSHPLKNMRGLPEADKFFPDPRYRQLTELIYPDRKQAFKVGFAGNWKRALFVWDEDDDCGRWERVELYDNADAFKLGSNQGGLDNNPQADVAGDRGEWDEDFSGGGDIYVGRFDGRIHLYGAERGAWRIDQ
ncbi:MAG: heparinase, partial [Bacteroidales bacterium]|nr:heparinase [Bacteroidales bacterium]